MMFDMALYTVWFIFIVTIFLWRVNLMILEKKKLMAFLPFLIIGCLFCFQGAFVFNGLFEQKAWLFVEIGFFISFLWIFLNLRREND